MLQAVNVGDFWTREGGFVEECRRVFAHKWNPNEVGSVEDVWQSPRKAW